MAVKVYGPAYSACTQRVIACLVELGIEYDIVPVDLMKGEQKKPEFLVKQPFGQVPAVEDGDFKLFESRAIIRYYAAKTAAGGGKNLLGNTLEEKALVDQWLEVEVNNYNPLVFTLVLQIMVLPRAGLGGDAKVIEETKGKLERVLDVYEERLSKTEYLAGDEFTIADLSHLPNTTFLIGQGGMAESIRRRESLNSWWNRISNRPSWKK
ncbi:hypothetical protein M569_01048, partial [Genlisea aurea]